MNAHPAHTTSSPRRSGNTANRGSIRRPALTIVELLMAMVGMTIVAAALASLVTAATTAMNDHSGTRNFVARHQVLDNRLSAAIRSAEMVLEKGATYMVLWKGDVDGSSFPDLSEIQLIEYNAGTDQVTSYEAPSSLDPAADVSYLLSDNFATITTAIKGGATFPASLWAGNVTAFALGFNNADEQLATVVTYSLDLSANGVTDKLVGVSSLRNH